MKYKYGDIVKVLKSGIHKNEEATIIEVNSMYYLPNHTYYTIKLKNKKCNIIINETDIGPIDLVKDGKECECGGDKLTIPHHYDWCPKFKKKNKELIKLFRESAEPNFVTFLNQLEALNGKNTKNYK